MIAIQSLLLRVQCFFSLFYFTIRNWKLVKILLIYQIPQIFIGSSRLLSGLTRFFWRQSYAKVAELSLEQRIINAFNELGPIFIKFGQIISTRVDMLPTDVALALEQLQDKVPPFPIAEAEAIIMHNTGQSIRKTFKSFDRKAIGSASLAQVHQAKLHNGRHVVVKLLRPGIQTRIATNLSMLYQLAKIIDNYHPNGKIIRASEVIRDYERSIHNEIDFLIEAANCSQMYRHMMNDNYVRVPRVLWKYCFRDMLVTEFVSGTEVNKFASDYADHSGKRHVAHGLLMLFLEQTFRDNFFHADMHPGNLIIDTTDKKRPVIQLVDFGIVGSMSHTDQMYIAKNLMAFFNRDYASIIDLHIESGWIPDMENKQNMMNEIRAIGEPLYAQPLKEISFAKVLAELLQIARQYRMVVQPQLILLQKTIFNIEGLARRLDPDLNLWEDAKPYVEQWIRQRYSISKSLYLLAERTPQLLRQLSEYQPRTKNHFTVPMMQPTQAPKQYVSNQILIAFIMGILLTLLLKN